MNILKATIQDLESIEKLESTLEHRNLSYNSLKNDLKNTTCYYALAKTDNNIVIGYAGMELLVDHADITAVATSIHYLRQGIATLLLNELFRKAKELNLNSIFLEVRASNIPAIKLYEKLGFKKISVRKNYYDNSEDAYIYLKDLVQ